MHRQPPCFSPPHFTPCPSALRLAVLVAATLTTGCRTLVSTGLEEGTPAPARGVAYCLPLGRVEIEVVKNAAGLEAQAAAVSAQKATAAARAAADSAKQAKASTQGKTSDKPGPEALTAQVQAAAPGLPAIPARRKTADIPDMPPSIPEGSGPITATPSSAGKVSTAWSYKIRYKATHYVPDTRRRFVVDYQPNLLSDDNLRIVVGQNSLLDLVEVTSEDKSVEVIKKLIETSGNIARIAAQAGGTRSASAEEVLFKASFDPTSETEVRLINQALQQVEGGPYEVRLTDRSAPGSKQMQGGCQPTGTGGQDFQGIVFRPALTYGLCLSRKGVAQELATVLLPNEAEILHLPVNRSAFIKKVQKLDFNDGMLVEAALKKPSEALGAVEIPLEISRALLALPGEIVADNVAALKGREDLSRQAADAAQAQRRLQRDPVEEQTRDRQAELKLLEAEQALQNFQPGS